MLSSSCSSARITILSLLKSYSPAEPLWISNVSDAYALQSGGCLSVHIVFRSLIVKLASTTETRCRYNKHTQFMQSSFLAISHSATFCLFFHLFVLLVDHRKSNQNVSKILSLFITGLCVGISKAPSIHH